MYMLFRCQVKISPHCKNLGSSMNVSPATFQIKAFGSGDGPQQLFDISDIPDISDILQIILKNKPDLRP